MEERLQMKHALIMMCAVAIILAWSAQAMNQPMTPYRFAIEQQLSTNKPCYVMEGNGITRFEYLDGSALEITDRGAMEPYYEEFRP